MFLGKWMGGEGHPVEENGVSQKQKNKGDIRREDDRVSCGLEETCKYLKAGWLFLKKQN